MEGCGAGATLASYHIRPAYALRAMSGMSGRLSVLQTPSRVITTGTPRDTLRRSLYCPCRPHRVFYAPVDSVLYSSIVKDLATGAQQDEANQREMPVRFLIVDDHEAMRRGLRSALGGAGWEVCAEASNGREAIDKVRELHPDVVILDISMPVMGGIEAAPEILKVAPRTKIVAFTMHESQQVKNEIARIGVHGLAVKSRPLSDLLETIESVLSR